jgi:hypothetical protein
VDRPPGFAAESRRTPRPETASRCLYRDARVEPIESAYTDTDLVNGVNYCYAVTVIDGTGNESARSEAAYARPTAGTPSD